MAAGSFRIGGAGAAPVVGFETLTSGSSGAPCRIARSFATWMASFRVNQRLFAIGPGLQVAVLGGLVQSLALYGAVEALSLGADLHLLDALRPDRQSLALAARRVALIYATPTQLRLLIEAGGAPLPDMQRIIVGGSKLDAGLRRDLRALAPAAELHEFYGAAETSFVTLAGPDCPADAVGAPYPGVDLQIRQGEVWVRSPYLFTGYAGDTAGSAQWDAGWLSVGEIGRLEAGFLFLSGRKGRVVQVADQNVFPEEVETFLLSQTGVQRAAVLPRPDGLRGQVLVAVLRGDAAQAAGIMAALRDRFGPLKSPKHLIWRDDWPVLASGKTDLAAIARRVAG